jgi:hypothetical protein
MVSMWKLYRTGTVLLTLSTLTTLTDSIRDGKSAQLTIYLTWVAGITKTLILTYVQYVHICDENSQIFQDAVAKCCL